MKAEKRMVAISVRVHLEVSWPRKESSDTAQMLDLGSPVADFISTPDPLPVETYVNQHNEEQDVRVDEARRLAKLATDLQERYRSGGPHTGWDVCPGQQFAIVPTAKDAPVWLVPVHVSVIFTLTSTSIFYSDLNRLAKNRIFFSVFWKEFLHHRHRILLAILSK